MRPELYRQMAALQALHWWFVARRNILATLIKQMALPPQARILEIGCGTGGNLAMLSAFGQVDAMEYDVYAREIAADLSGLPIAAGGLPEPVPFGNGQFDLVCLLDVLEHIADDAAALGRVRQLLRPGGRILVTVPAYGWLWSSHDTAHHHYRRYTAEGLRRLAAATGLKVVRSGYFNTLLFPLIAVVRVVGKLVGSSADSDAAMPSPWLNTILKNIFSLERHLVRYRLFPFGTSATAILSPERG